ncbi:hypothetical protein GWI33_009624 [Rhynchophorus ferrugineus]|uniref:Pupal cuticle protein 20-like n=1 Tax=Rhynchophorus ferrugineus TaxID=354439 RepID=A0A834I9C7_RHYFE|nr:hypothetical protein GWI33_009624 [Rhynchophorus ferrugineus]
MKQFVVVSAILCLASCAKLDHLYLPPNPAAAGNFGPSSAPFGGPAGARSGLNVPILRFAAQNEGDGTYRYSYETGNNINAEEQGEARGAGTKAHGSFSYISPEGQHVSISYTADENGFVPQGSHIPTPPPIPEAILKSLQENAAAAARGYGAGSAGSGFGAGGTGNGFGAGGAGSGAYAGNGGYRY